MKQRLGSALTLVISLFALWAVSSTSAAEYAEVNDIQLYYEIHGDGPTPVVMLHGGYDDSDVWELETWLLSYDYTVIEIDSRGHGRSYDGDGPITYELMASDTMALLDQLGVGRAHFVGWSDGAVIATQIASAHEQDGAVRRRLWERRLHRPVLSDFQRQRPVRRIHRQHFRRQISRCKSEPGKLAGIPRQALRHVAVTVLFRRPACRNLSGTA